MSQICSFEDCGRDVFQDRRECVLHCEKKRISSEELLKDFYIQIIDYIAKDIVRESPVGSKPKLERIKQILEYYDNESKITQTLVTQSVHFDNIKFPFVSSNYVKYYPEILNHLKTIYFNSCEFIINFLYFSKAQSVYADCEFFEHWQINQYNSQELMKGIFTIHYLNCTFHKSVSFNNLEVVDRFLFKDCTFKNSLILSNLKFKKSVFNNTKDADCSINSLEIRQCEFEDKFILNKLKAKSLKIEDTEFLSKLELKHGDIDKVKIINSNFKGLFDAYCTQFDQFSASKSIFSDFVGFEKCEFGKSSNEKDVARFEYATFLSFTNFRNTVFHAGLDFEDTNLKEAPNFLNVEFKSGVKNTNR